MEQIIEIVGQLGLMQALGAAFGIALVPWLFALLAAAIGSGKKIGGFWAFYLTYFLSLIGLIITFVSKKVPVGEPKTKWTGLAFSGFVLSLISFGALGGYTYKLCLDNDIGLEPMSKRSVVSSNNANNTVADAGNTAGNNAAANADNNVAVNNTDSGNNSNASASNNNTGNASANNNAANNNNNAAGNNTPIVPAVDPGAQEQAEGALGRARDALARDEYSTALDEIRSVPAGAAIESFTRFELMQLRCRATLLADLDAVTADSTRASDRVPVMIINHAGNRDEGWMTRKDFDTWATRVPDQASNATFIIRRKSSKESYRTVFVSNVNQIAPVRDPEILADYYEPEIARDREKWMQSGSTPIEGADYAFALQRWAALTDSDELRNDAYDQLVRALDRCEGGDALLDQSIALSRDRVYLEYLEGLSRGVDSAEQTRKLETLVKRFPYAWQFVTRGVAVAVDGDEPTANAEDVARAHQEMAGEVEDELDRAEQTDDEDSRPKVDAGATFEAALNSDNVSEITGMAREMRSKAEAADRRSFQDPDNMKALLEEAVFYYTAARQLYERANKLEPGQYENDLVAMNRSIFWCNKRRPF